MNTLFKYFLDKSSKKHICPNCEKKRFVKYIDAETNNYLPSKYGRCDSESKCNYHLNPYNDNFGKDLNLGYKYTPIPYVKPKRVFIPNEVLIQTLNGYDKNIFIQNLLTNIAYPFDVKDIEKIISMYRLGTVQNGYRKGANTFPFIDVNNNIRAIQVKQFDKKNHTVGTDFLHSVIDKHNTRNNIDLPEWLKAYNKNDIKVSCLFGEHLLSKYPLNPIALVEAPKTAIYSTLYFGTPEQTTNLLWLAVYNLSSLNLDKCKSLKGRAVYLFPDLSKDGKAFELWSNKAKDIQSKLHGTRFHVSDLLEQFAPEEDKDHGNDLADYLIKLDWRLFRKIPIDRPIEKTVKYDPDFDDFLLELEDCTAKRDMTPKEYLMYKYSL